MTPALVLAAEQGNIADAARLINDGEDLNAIDQLGRTAMMAATHTNHPAVVELLINAGADVNIQDGLSDNPFLYAGAEGLIKILRLTIAAGANTKLTNRFGGTALIPACHHGYSDCALELLTRTDVDINHVNRLGWTALMEAVILSDGGPIHQQIVQILVDHGADRSIADNDGFTPLQHAGSRGFTEMVRILQG